MTIIKSLKASTVFSNNDTVKKLKEKVCQMSEKHSTTHLLHFRKELKSLIRTLKKLKRLSQNHRVNFVSHLLKQELSNQNKNKTWLNEKRVQPTRKHWSMLSTFQALKLSKKNKQLPLLSRNITLWQTIGRLTLRSWSQSTW